MRLIGVTGGIATGKSTVDRMLAAHGAAVIDADELAREAVRPGAPALAAVAARFGSELIRPDGSLDRPRLGEIVFADPEARRELERITHPRITELIGERIAAALAGPAPLVAVDIPLLFENSRESLFEGVLLVYASPEVQLERLRERNGLDAAAALQRLAAQIPIDDKRARATWIIDNGASLDATARAVDVWWEAAVTDQRAV
jgi:dephospho-CoA kinase